MMIISGAAEHEELRMTTTMRIEDKQ